MKTINDLVDHLNATFDYADFFIKESYDQRAYYIDMKTFDDYGSLIEFDKQSKRWFIGTTLGLASDEVQKEIMDFVYGTDKIHWFDEPEKKYNIIIGKDSGHTGCLNVYRKEFYFEQHYDCDVELADEINVFLTDDRAQKEDLKKEEYQFTESEIEYLKSKLPDNMAKIVDLGKVEVKDD